MAPDNNELAAAQSDTISVSQQCDRRVQPDFTSSLPQERHGTRLEAYLPLRIP